MPDYDRTIQEIISEVSKTRSAVDERLSYKGKPVADAISEIEQTQKLMSDRQSRISTALDTVSKRRGRPGSGDPFDSEHERSQAIGLLHVKHASHSPKVDPGRPGDNFSPSEEQIAEAQLAVKALRSLMKTTSLESLPLDQRKALSSFSLGSSGYFLPPEISSQVLSCLESTTDVTGLVSSVNISGPSIKFFVDNVRLDEAAWACQTACFANQPGANFLDGLGELEIRVDPLRAITCATRDLIEDASIDVELWLTRKVSQQFRDTISNAVMVGDGAGKPLGILNPIAGIPIVETGAGTPPGQFGWADLVLMKYQVAPQYHARGRYLMNAQTFGILLTRSDGMGRPIMLPSPVAAGEYQIAGSPISIVSQMPDVSAGSTPIAFGDWKSAYMLALRKGVTMYPDPYTAGWCMLFKWEARVGGSVTCVNAARLLRIRFGSPARS